MADNSDDSEPEFDPIALARRNARRKAVTEIAVVALLLIVLLDG